MPSLCFDKANDRFEWIGDYYSKDIPKGAGFRWDPREKVWWSDRKDSAVKLVSYADTSCKKMLTDYLRSIETTLVASKAVDADIDVQSPDGLDYLPFQLAGIAFMQSRRNTLLGDEMGLGKTVEALGFINSDSSIKKVLIICPASLKINWAMEAQRWLVKEWNIEIVTRCFPVPKKSGIVIINYDVLKKYTDAIRAIEWDLLIADEIHLCKNSKAQRTRQVLGHKPKKGSDEIEISPIPAKRKAFLTGTPLVNRPIELWTIISALAPQTFPTFWNFVTTYCNATKGEYGWDFTGASNLDELQEKLRSSIMIRRLKSEVLKELPPKRRQVIEMPDISGTRAVADENAAWEQREDLLNDLKVAVELSKASDDPEDYREAVADLREAAQAAFTEISKLRHATALAKLPYVIEHVREIILSGNKVVVFAHHHDVINRLHEEFGVAAVKLTGKMSIKARQASVDRFQEDSDVMLFVGQTQAAGLGITLTAASHVVFAELDWVPGTITQAEDRLHRKGQEESVLVQHLVLEGSLDAHMAQVLVDKQEVLDAVLDNLTNTLEQEEPIFPTATVGATSTTSKQKIKKLAEKLTMSDVKLVHGAIEMLAGMCDGAMAQDGHGFNKIDTMVGKSLAGMATLSKKQAAMGLRICQKYQKQLFHYYGNEDELITLFEKIGTKKKGKKK